MPPSEHRYFRPAEYVVRQARFKYLGGEYSGPGLLTWSAKAGFHLEAFVTRTGPQLPSPLVFGIPRTIRPDDRRTIRMDVQAGMFAVHSLALAEVTLVDRFDLIHEARLSINIPKVAFVKPLNAKIPEADWYGSALLDLGTRPLLPDKIQEEVKLDGRVVRTGDSAAGLSFQDSPRRMSGMLIDERHSSLHWALDRQKYRKQASWRWPEAFRDALRVLLNHSVALLQREADTRPFSRQEFRRSSDIVSLHPFVLIKDDWVDKDHLMALTHLFLCDHQAARTSRHILSQAFRAARQPGWADRELIWGTILEGALRSLEGIPSTDRRWQLHDSLLRFRDQYFDIRWRKACKRVESAFERLRHTNAHPDWIIDRDGAAGATLRQQGFDDIRLLSRFYGYMLLALAGIKGLEPDFD